VDPVLQVNLEMLMMVHVHLVTLNVLLVPLQLTLIVQHVPLVTSCRTEPPPAPQAALLVNLVTAPLILVRLVMSHVLHVLHPM
jgi:hypothetical protein